MVQVIALASIATVVLTAAAFALAAPPAPPAAAARQSRLATEGAAAEVPAGQAPSLLPATISRLPAAGDQAPAAYGQTAAPPSCLPAAVNLIVTVPVIVGGLPQREPEAVSGSVAISGQSWEEVVQRPDAGALEELPAQLAPHRYQLPVRATALAAPQLLAAPGGSQAAVDVVA